MKAKQLTLISTIAIGIAGCIGIVSILGAVNGTNVSALTYQSTINSEFTINPAINVSLSSADLIINDLEPGTTKDSNIITVTVSTNNSSGYTLGSTVGNSTTYDYDALKNNVDNTKSFTNLTSTGSLTAGKWGYSYSNDNGTNWSTYNGLPLYSATPVEIASSTSATTTNTQFKIGAYAATGQAAGEYNNVVNFIATASPEPHYYMQDFTLSQCAVNVGEGDNPANIGDAITVYDRRDEKDYTVRYINGGCWMTQNLRITGIVPAEGSNFTGSDFNVSQYSLDANDVSYANHCDKTNSYNYVCSKNSNDNATGVWYNFAAATAGVITGLENDDPAVNDICPAGWHLPSGPNATSGTDFNKLIGNTVSGWQSATAGLTNFDPVAGGNYDDGNLEGLAYGRWWSATTGSGSKYYRYRLAYNNSNNQFVGDGQVGRYLGYFIRCVRSS